VFFARSLRLRGPKLQNADPKDRGWCGSSDRTPGYRLSIVSACFGFPFYRDQHLGTALIYME
jgi:hypothetical protein